MTPLLPEMIGSDPIRALGAWIDEARAGGQPQPVAMALATAGASGQASARMVFLRAWGSNGLEWVTDEASRKARDIAERRAAAGVLFWPGLGRQLRVEGSVTPLSRPEVEAHFARRGPDARMAAWAGRQGEVVEGRAALRRMLSAAESRFAGSGAPAPPYWTGHRLRPDVVEFWQEDPEGLHDRILAHRTGAEWTVERLAP